MMLIRRLNVFAMFVVMVFFSSHSFALDTTEEAPEETKDQSQLSQVSKDAESQTDHDGIEITIIDDKKLDEKELLSVAEVGDKVVFYYESDQDEKPVECPVEGENCIVTVVTAVVEHVVTSGEDADKNGPYLVVHLENNDNLYAKIYSKKLLSVIKNKKDADDSDNEEDQSKIIYRRR